MQPKLMFPNVRHILTIASGKGGVGKTTTTVNLALALHRTGAQVGIFDADIYGPNVPILLGIHQKRKRDTFLPIVRPHSAPPYIKPLQRHGLQIMSVGLLMSEEQVINPPPDAVGQLVVQTLKDIIWQPLDYLLIDLPPSAGQPQQDLLTRIAIGGAVIVTTPQDMSLLDASRSLQMFVQHNVPILGLVENMSYFVCPSCGEAHEIFSRASQTWRPPLLDDVAIIGKIPILPSPLVHEGDVFDEVVTAVTHTLPLS